ncbi:MAG: hypothetical protein P8J86_02420 [Phycisphaerales bacterium]|nr:hypothetical protein [Phycisphaerales bacterium]
MASLIFALAFVLLTVAMSVRPLFPERRLPLDKETFLEWSPKTLWLPLPGRHETLAHEVVLILFLLLLAIFLMVSLGARSNGIVGFLVLLAALLCLFLALKEFKSRRYTKKHLRQTYVAGLLSVIQQANLPQRSSSSQHAKSTITALDSGFKQQGTSRPEVIADLAFIQSLRSIALLPGLPEPEHVLASSKRKISNIVISLILAANALGLALLYGQIICLAVGFVFLISGLLPLPPVRRFVRQFQRDSKGLIAGPGFTVSSSGQIWNTEDSVAIIRAAQLCPNRFASVYLQLIGPAGCKQMSFGSISDPDFLCFWQRWTHPEARPELAASLAADMLPS